MNGGQATIGFAAHLANWEIPAVGAKDRHQVRRAVPAADNRARSAMLIVKLRTPLMGEMIPTTLDAPVRLAQLLQSGVHVGMLADQHYTSGVEVTFFGRPCNANPLIALLARQTGARSTACAWCAIPTATASGARSPTRSSRRATPTAVSTSRAPCRR